MKKGYLKLSLNKTWVLQLQLPEKYTVPIPSNALMFEERITHCVAMIRHFRLAF